MCLCPRSASSYSTDPAPLLHHPPTIANTHAHHPCAPQPVPDVGVALDDIDAASSPCSAMLCSEAKRHGIYLIGGSVPECVAQADGKPPLVFNTCIVAGPDGTPGASHRLLAQPAAEAVVAVARLPETEQCRQRRVRILPSRITHYVVSNRRLASRFLRKCRKTRRARSTAKAIAAIALVFFRTRASNKSMS